MSMSALSAHTRNLYRLALLRLVWVTVLALLAWGTGQWVDEPLLARPAVHGPLTLLVLLTLATLWRLRRPWPVQERELFAQLTADVVLMTVLLYGTGGGANPLVSWYLLPLTISAAALSFRYTVLLAVMAVAAYSLLQLSSQPFVLFTPLASEHAHHQGHAGFNLHLLGMWLTFLLSAALIVAFVGGMSTALREQDQQLARQRERLMQQEQLVALGALAANTAHELGTPLATMSLLVGELAESLPAEASMQGDLRLLREQLGLCRDSLRELRAEVDGSQAVAQPLGHWLSRLLQRLELLYPARRFQLDVPPALAPTPWPLPVALRHVLVNLLNNAAQAARDQVILSVQGAAGGLVFRVENDGAALAADELRLPRQPLASAKRDGLGLGLYLSQASVDALGGSLRLMPRDGGGACAELFLPLAEAAA